MSKDRLGKIVHIMGTTHKCGEHRTVLREHEHGFSRTLFQKGEPKHPRREYSWKAIEHKQWMKGEEV